MPFYLAPDRDVQPAAVPGVVACRCCPGGISRSTRPRRYPSDMTGAEWAVCEPLLPATLHPVTTWARQPEENSRSRRDENAQVKRKAQK